MSESLHQRSLITCILTRREFEASCFCEISCFAFPDLDDRSLAFPLSTCAKVGWGVLSEGMPVWAKNVENVQERWRLDHRGQAGGPVWYLPLTVDERASGESDGAQNAPQPPANFRLHTLSDPLYLGISGRAMKDRHRWLRVRCPGREPSDKRSPGLLLGFRSTPHISHLTPAVSKHSDDMINKTWAEPALSGPTGVWNIVSFVFYFG